MFLWMLKIKIMTKVIFKITTVLATLLSQVYDSETKLAVENGKTEMSCPVSDSVHARREFKLVLSSNKKNQPS